MDQVRPCSLAKRIKKGFSKMMGEAFQVEELTFIPVELGLVELRVDTTQAE